MNTKSTISIKSAAPLSLRLDPGVRSRLVSEATAEDRSLSYMAQKAIVAYLDGKENKRRATALALADSDKGVFISDGAMTSWIDSWDTDNELPIPKADIFKKVK